MACTSCQLRMRLVSSCFFAGENMSRIPQDELENLKQQISLERLVEQKGISLKKHGQDLIGHCPFHDDSNQLMHGAPRPGRRAGIFQGPERRYQDSPAGAAPIRQRSKGRSPSGRRLWCAVRRPADLWSPGRGLGSAALPRRQGCSARGAPRCPRGQLSKC
jgi:hypothetical protein